MKKKKKKKKKKKQQQQQQKTTKKQKQNCHWTVCSKDGIVHFLLEGQPVEIPISIYILSVISSNSAGPDEIPHPAAFHLGLRCLPKVHL